MTYAAVPVLRVQPELAALWFAPLTADEYDPRLVPVAQKSAALCGMGMTEKQGGSDVRANQTRASAGRGPRRRPRILLDRTQVVLLRTDERRVSSCSRKRNAGLSCFLVPRVLADGARNPFAILRLKNKLGNRSNASARLSSKGRTAG